MRLHSESGIALIEALAPLPTAGSLRGKRTAGSAPARGTGASAPACRGRLEAEVCRAAGVVVRLGGGVVVVDVVAVVDGVVVVVGDVDVEGADVVAEVGSLPPPHPAGSVTASTRRGTAYTGRTDIEGPLCLFAPKVANPGQRPTAPGAPHVTRMGGPLSGPPAW